MRKEIDSSQKEIDSSQKESDSSQPGDHSEDATPHSSLNNPVSEPDPTEWPDPYDKREDPRGEGRPVSGSTSTSAPHPSQDPEAEPSEAPERDKLDD
jgi:hypothetical protein